MTPDTPINPHDEDQPSRIFDETRPSTLASAAPTSGSETLVPTPEIAEVLEVDTPANEPEATLPDEVSNAEPTIAIAPEADLAEEETDTDELTDEPAAEPQATLSPEPSAEPVTIEATAPTVTFETANPALALAFAPAPDAPFQSSVTVGISCGAPNARIFYTLDGTAPDRNSTAYDKDKILLTQSAMLSARAFGNGQSGPIQSADYIVSKPMWQENEPADQTDPTAHKASKNWSAPDGWQIGAASVRGKLHAHRALWREDAFALGDAGEWSIAIVSDGAGSAPLSRVGSHVACEAALGSLQSALGALETLSDETGALQQTDLPRVREALMRAAIDALDAIRAQADERGRPLSAFAATLLILVRRAWNESQICASLQVGDGAIALDCESGLKMLGEADHGQHSSETRFLTTGGIEASLASRVKFSLPADLRATLVVSDGVSDDYFPEDKRLIEVFDAVKPLAADAPDAGAALLEWLGYEKKGSSDDRTIALSWPASMGANAGAAAQLEAELDEPKAQVAKGESVAGLPPSSNPNDAETRLEEGGSPAVTQPSQLREEARLEEGGSPAPPQSSAPASPSASNLNSPTIEESESETDLKLSPATIEATEPALHATPLLDEFAAEMEKQSAPEMMNKEESSDGV